MDGSHGVGHELVNVILRWGGHNVATVCQLWDGFTRCEKLTFVQQQVAGLRVGGGRVLGRESMMQDNREAGWCTLGVGPGKGRSERPTSYESTVGAM